MLLQLVVSLVPFVDLQHHGVEFTIKGIVCGILRGDSSIDDRHCIEVCSGLVGVTLTLGLTVAAWGGRLALRSHRRLVVVLRLLVRHCALINCVLIILATMWLKRHISNSRCVCWLDKLEMATLLTWVTT